jgi:hypothetical protein
MYLTQIKTRICSPATHTVVQRQGWQKNNSKNRCQNFREIIFFKKLFFVW